MLNSAKKHNGRNIYSKIVSSVLAVALVANLVLGLSGLIGIFIVRSATDRIYNDDLMPLRPLFQFSSDFSYVGSQLRNFLMASSTDTITTQDVDGSIADMDQQLAEYGRHLRTGAERRNYALIRQNFNDYKKNEQQFVKNLQLGQKWQAQQALAGRTESNLLSAVSNAFSLSDAQARSSAQTNAVIFWCVFALIVGCIGAATMLTLRSCRRVARGISEPIGALAAAAESIARGDLSVDAGIDSEDETGALARAFRQIIGSLTHLKTDVEFLIGEAREGRLDSRADPAPHSGSYREIVQGVNEMLDTVKAPLDVASAYVDRLADGEAGEDQPDVFPGYYGTLIENLNHVRASVGVLAQEAAKLAEAGREGRLDVRGDTSRVKGVYAQIVRGVNDTFDAFKAPLDVAAVYIARLARGDDTEELENSYRGYYAKIIDNLNAVNGSFGRLLGEAQKLAEAGKAGNLLARGSTEGLSGCYARVIESFNAAFGAIASPILEAQDVLGKMAVDDFTAGMSGDCAGMLRDLSESVNAVLATLRGLQQVFARLAEGDLSMLGEYRAGDKKSANDEILPALARTLQTLRGLIDETGALEREAARGNLGARGDDAKYAGGYREIVRGVNRILGAVASPIEESSQVLGLLAQGDLTVAVAGSYEGEYDAIKRSLNGAIASVGGVLAQIWLSAGQVSAGARQVSDGSQSLSQGAASQAGAVEELTSTVAEMAACIEQNAGQAGQASGLAAAVSEEAIRGNDRMQTLLAAIGEIRSASENISKIIKVIDDIAFQTNILALNAAVEAARAGQAGKGFAVVAEEVRNLASRSANAARQTTELIESSLEKVRAGSLIADETAKQLSGIAQQSKKSAALADSIAAALAKQAVSIRQIDAGLDQISAVVQNNSSTAEQSAASSEELSGQAEELLRQVALFRLPEGAGAAG